MDRTWVKDIQIGQHASGVFLVARKQQATGKNGKTFLKIVLQDKTGQIDARAWSQAEELASTFEAGDRVEAEGQVGSFQGRPQLTIERLEKSQAELDAKDFEYEAPPEAPADRKAGASEGMLRALHAELARVGDPHVRALLLSFVDDPDIAGKLRRAPAAKEIHHAYPGGLLEHILSCVRLARRLADHYPMADADLLVAGAFLHDIGKVTELSYDKGGTGYSDEGRLVGHLVITAGWIRDRARVISGFPKDLEIHLIHLVLAHHGRLEYGSPKLPMTLEAFLVHELDEIDSRVNSMLAQMARSASNRWAEPQKHHERLLWKGPAPTEEGRKRGSPARGYGKQRPSRKERREAAGAEAPAEPRRRERPPRARAAQAPAGAEAPAQAPRAAREAGGERRGPKILKHAEGKAAGGGEKLTFKPFSAFTHPPEEEGQPERPPEAEAHPAAEAPETPQTPAPAPAAQTQETVAAPTTSESELAAAPEPAPTTEAADGDQAQEKAGG